VPNYGPENQPIYTQIAAGRINTSTSAAQAPTQVCGLVQLRNLGTTGETIYLGASSSVTTSNGYPLAPGDVSPWIPIDNLNRLYVIAASGTPQLAYLALV
jgi:hypothetical protein